MVPEGFTQTAPVPCMGASAICSACRVGAQVSHVVCAQKEKPIGYTNDDNSLLIIIIKLSACAFRRYNLGRLWS